MSTGGCGLLNSKDDKQELVIKPYYLMGPNQLPVSIIRGVELTNSEVLNVYGDEEWAQSFDQGETFEVYQNPEDVYFTKILKYKGTFYGLGAHSISHPTFGDSDSTNFLFGFTNSIFRSQDGINWEQDIAMLTMRDFAFQDDTLLHMGIYEGIRTLNLNSGVFRDKSFFSSKLSDLVNEFYISADGEIFAGTHDGVYKSIDKGENWTRVSESQILKDDDTIDSFFISGESLYAVGKKIHVSNDDGITWESVDFGFIDEAERFQDLPGYGSYVTEDGFIFSASYFGILVSRTSNPDDAEFILKHDEDSYSGTSSRYDKVITFQNGNFIAIEETLGRSMRGVKNEKSPFWSTLNN